jgi:hypothetical protein
MGKANLGTARAGYLSMSETRSYFQDGEFACKRFLSSGKLRCAKLGKTNKFCAISLARWAEWLTVMQEAGSTQLPKGVKINATTGEIASDMRREFGARKLTIPQLAEYVNVSESNVLQLLKACGMAEFWMESEISAEEAAKWLKSIEAPYEIGEGELNFRESFTKKGGAAI